MKPESTAPISKENLTEEQVSSVSSLKELVEIVTGRAGEISSSASEIGADVPPPFPFLAIVGQNDTKLALTLALINPAVGGVLVIGPRGTGKTTAVRSLVDLLPRIERSACTYGCLAEDIEVGGMDAVCPACAKKFGQGESLSTMETMRLVELPLNAQMEDVLGGLDERAAANQRFSLKRGILSSADNNLLYIDEVNLLADEVINTILDSSAAGRYTVRRGPISATYRSRFILIGSMNPEEGLIRPQLLDRFGLRVLAQGLQSSEERWLAYEYAREYQQNPLMFSKRFKRATEKAREEILEARALLPRVELDSTAALSGIRIIQNLNIHSTRAELSLFEAARAYAASSGKLIADWEDIRAVAPLALRMRRSSAIHVFLREQELEAQALSDLLDSTSD